MAFAVPMIIGGIKAVGTIVGGIEDANNYGAIRDASRANATHARQDARTELQIATADAEAKRREGNRRVAEQVTSFAQSGFGFGGDVSSAISQSAAEAELDALNIQYKGQLRNRAKIAEGISHDQKADAASRAKKAVPFKTAIGAATQLLSGYAGGQGAGIS